MTAVARDGREASPNPIREGLDHPVIDSDAHMIEHLDTFFSYLDEVGGPGMVDRYRAELQARPVGSMGDAEKGEARTGFWGFPNDARDLATAMIPGLLHDRLGELGLDYVVVYPSLGIPLLTIQDSDIRRAAVRAENLMNADRFKPYADRITPAAVIPMHTPEEAVDELRHARRQLGFKVAAIPAGVARPLPAYPDAFPSACHFDSYGLDSKYDYDPVWRAFVELGLPVTAHIGAAMRYLPSGRRSPSNFCFNHIGAHAFAQSNLNLSLVMGGVLQRFPDLPFAFLEGGIGWACDLLPSIGEHWRKRGIENLLANLDPSRTDVDLFTSYVHQYGQAAFTRVPIENVKPPGGSFATSSTMSKRWTPDDVDRLDEWATSGITDERAFHALYSANFYFGCESGDPGVVRAAHLGRNGGLRLKSIFSSDIGHYDVPSMSLVLEEAHESVDHGDISAEEWRAFVYDNPREFWTRMDPDFFAGTAIEDRSSER